MGNINTHLHVVYAMFVEPSAALLQIRELIYYIGPNHFPYQLKLAKQYVTILSIFVWSDLIRTTPLLQPGKPPTDHVPIRCVGSEHFIW